MVTSPVLNYANFDNSAFNDDETFVGFTTDISTSWNVRERISTVEPHGGTIVVSDTAVIPLVSTPVPTRVVYVNGIPAYQFIAGLTATDQGTTWSVLQTVRQVRGTSWAVDFGCRGTKTFLPFDISKTLTAGQKVKEAYVPQITICALGSAVVSLSSPDQSGQYALIAQTPALYMDSRGYIFYKNTSRGYLGNARTITPSSVPAYASQIAILKTAFANS